jgi:hypothetical protein
MSMQCMLYWAAIIAAILAPSPSHAACAPKRPYCQSLPSRTDETVAIFTGKVKRVTAPAITTAPPEPRNVQPGLASGRYPIGGPLQNGKKVYPTATFEVAENFIGAKTAEFTVLLTSDAFVGDIPIGTPTLGEGETWLIEAYYDPHVQQWMTSTCQRTKPVSQADEDLEALRAWIGGTRLPGRVQGQVANPDKGKYVSGVRVVLRGSKDSFSTTTDERGQFSFDGLEPGLYEATTDGARAMSADLSHSWCSYVVFIVK